jgi:hypothetical protein
VQLERLSVQLRPRGGWEAVDLGFQMARSWWRSIWGVWLSVYLPAAFALHAAFHDRLWIAIVLLWWLKPAFDRFVLHVVSRAVFGSPPTINETLGAWRDILRPGLARGLTLGRFDLARSFTMPVWQLEKQAGHSGRTRRNTLGKRMRGYAAWLTVIALHFETLFILSFGLLLALLTPAGGDSGFEFSELFEASDPNASWWEAWDLVDSICYVAAVSLIEPVYVAGGFSLYLNRRAILEGWDIELALRRLDERLRPALASFVAIAVLGAVASTVAAPRSAEAAEKDAQQEIRAVLEATEFQQFKEEPVWRYRGEHAADNGSLWINALRNLGALLAEASQALLWVTAAFAVIALALMLRRYLPRFIAQPPSTYRPPDMLFGLAVAPASLPDDVASAALALAREGQIRAALSLLYRGALSALVHRDHVPIVEGDTEGDALGAAQRALPQPAADYFARLVHAWTRAAYSGTPPEAAVTEALARDWPAHFARQMTEAAA